MSEYKCLSNNASKNKHEWEYHTDSGWSVNGVKPTYLICKHCHKLITAPELFQLKAIKNQTITTKVLVITTIVSFLTLILSLFKII